MITQEVQVREDDTIVVREYDPIVLPGGPARARELIEKKLFSRVVVGDESVALKATHHVGLFPIPAGNGHPAQLITVLPKLVPAETAEGVSPNALEALGLFFDWVEAAQGTKPRDAKVPPDPERTGGDLVAQVQEPAAHFMLMLASRYANTLTSLARRGLRRHYRREEETLRGRVRGRVRVVPYGRNLALGRPDLVPVAWDEFTLDHDANRLLRAAAEALVARGVALDAECGRRMRGYFRGPLAHLAEVESVAFPRNPPVSRSERDLRRLSPDYDRALGWARLILAGSGTTRVDGRLGVLAIDTNKVFEDFALRIAEKAMGSSTVQVRKEALDEDILEHQQRANPDIVIRRNKAYLAIGDAKYKRILAEPPPTEELVELGVEQWKIRLARADLYQMYAYMRLAEAKRGFFVAPCWEEKHDAAHLERVTFAKPPVDGAKLGVLFLNLAWPIRGVMTEGDKALRAFVDGD